MAVVDSFDTNNNFWEVNPQLKVAGPFKDLYTSDKSTNKLYSSKKMWCIALISDRKSMYYNLPEKEKIELVFEDYFGDKSWPSKNEKLFLELCAFYVKLSDTSAMRTLRQIEDKLEERAKFLKETNYTMGEKGDKGWVWGTVDTIDRMMANTKKIYDMYDEARKIVEQEEASGTTVGNNRESPSDTGDI